METAIYIKEKTMLKKIIKFVSVTSSKIGSKKAGTSPDAAQERQDAVADAIKEAKDDMKELDSEASVDEGW